MIDNSKCREHKEFKLSEEENQYKKIKNNLTIHRQSKFWGKIEYPLPAAELELIKNLCLKKKIL